MTVLANMTDTQKAEFKAAGDTSGLLTKDQAASGTGVTASTLAGQAAAQVAVGINAQSLGAIIDWDMSALAGLTDGSPISVVPDKGGRGAPLIQLTGANRPSKQTVNGRAVARFSGASAHYLNGLTLGSAEPSLAGVASPYTMVFVVRPSTFDQQVATEMVLLQGSGNPTLTVSILNGPDHQGTVQVSGNSGSGTLQSSGPMPSIMDGNWHIIIVDGDASGTTVYVDGYWVCSIAGNVLGFGSVTRPAIGSQQNGAAKQFTGDIARLLIFDKRLGAAQKLALTQNLTSEASLGILSFDNTYDGWFAPDDRTDPAGNNYRLFRPAKSPETPTVVIWCHPQGADRNIGTTYFAYTLARTCLGLGFHFFASDMGNAGTPGGSASSWGNATSQAAIRYGYDLIAGETGKTPNVILIGASMGGFAASLAIIKGTFPPGSVKDVLYIDPALDAWAMVQANYLLGTINTTASSAMTAGVSNSFASPVSIAANTRITIEYGGASPEQATVQSASGSGPYTITLTAPVNASHASGVSIRSFGSYDTSIEAGYAITVGALASDAAIGAMISSTVSFPANTKLAIDVLGVNMERVEVQSVSGAGPYTITLKSPLAYPHSKGAKIGDHGSKLEGNNPMEASVANFAGLPVRFTASPSDTAVIKALNTDLFRAKLAGIAQDNGLVIHVGGHLATQSGAANSRDFTELAKRSGL